MIDHLSIGVNDIEKAATFYDAVMAVLEYRQLAKFDNIIAYGNERIEFLAMLPFDGRDQTAGNGTHIAFKAKTQAQVNLFYVAALNNQGICAGEPGIREYPHGEVYTTYVRDPFGNKLEAICGGFKP